MCPESRLFTPRLSAPGSCSGNLSSVLYTHGSYELAGLCGASMVSRICLCAVLNELIDSGWELANRPALEVDCFSCLG